MNLQYLYEAILKTNLINFCIMTGTLVWIFKYFKLGKIIDNMEYDIRHNVNSSAQAVQNALNEYKKQKKNFKTIPERKQAIIDEAKKNVSGLEEKNALETEAKLNELLGDDLKRRNLSFERKTQTTVKEIQAAVAKISIETIKTMLNEEMHAKIISNSLDEFDKIKAGQND